MRASNDVIRTAPAVSWIAVRVALVVVVFVGAMVLCPLAGWRWVAVSLALVGAVLPQTFAAWGSVACMVIGMIISEPDLGRAMLAVLIVQLIHVLTSLALVFPRGSRILFAALRPTAERLLLIQTVAQPLTVVVLLGATGAGPAWPWAVAAGAGAIVAASVMLVVTSNRRAG